MLQTLKHEIDRKKDAQMNRRTIMQNKEKKKERETAADFNSRQPISSTSSSVMAPDSSGEVWMYGLSNWLDWLVLGKPIDEKSAPSALTFQAHSPPSSCREPSRFRWDEADLGGSTCSMQQWLLHAAFPACFHCSLQAEEELKDNAGLFLTPCSGTANANDKAGTFGWSAVQKKPTRSCYIEVHKNTHWSASDC